MRGTLANAPATRPTQITKHMTFNAASLREITHWTVTHSQDGDGALGIIWSLRDLANLTVTVARISRQSSTRAQTRPWSASTSKLLPGGWDGELHGNLVHAKVTKPTKATAHITLNAAKRVISMSFNAKGIHGMVATLRLEALNIVVDTGVAQKLLLFTMHKIDPST